MKKLLLLLVIPFLSLGQEQWFQTFGGLGNDRGNVVQQTNDGGYIVVGSTSSFEAWSGDNQDVYLIKTDENGNELWSQTFGDGSTNSGRCGQQTNDGGYIITGWYGLDVVLIKTNENGNEQWSQTFSSGSNNSANSVKQTIDGGYIIVGHTDDGPVISADIYMIKTDENGNEQWSRTFGGTNIDIGYSIQQTSDEGYIITGETNSFGNGSTGVYLIKTNENGEEEWSQTFGGESGYSVEQTNDGGYIITGRLSVESEGEYGSLPCILLIKTDENGSEQWSQNFVKIYTGKGYSVQQTSDNGYIITGERWSFLNENIDVVLIKTNSEGNVKSTNIIETPTISKNLITTIDILGRETANNKGFQLHIYDDGSVEKKYLIK